MPSYDDIRHELQTGDIVLFSGKGRISAAIKWFSGSKWSHVGMVVRSDDWDMLLLWESTTLSSLKTVEGTNKEGVQTVFLSQRVDTYNGEISIRKLNVERTPQMIDALKSLRSEVKNRPYEEDKWELIKSALDIPFIGDNEEDLSSLFCSEMVAEAYQRMGLLGEDLPSNEYTPRDFSTECAKELQLLGGATLSPEILLS